MGRHVVSRSRGFEGCGWRGFLRRRFQERLGATLGVRPTPWTNLAENEELSGIVIWTGALLGITPSTETVVGDSRLAVDLADLEGQLDFVNLQFDDGGMWRDGDLGYSVEVRGNTFIQIQGDTGVVTGAFLGPRHEGMGGVLERSDLSAAFGGKR